MSDFVPWLRRLAEDGGKGVVNNIDARCLGRIADELERLRSIAIERMDLFRQAATKVEELEAQRSAVQSGDAREKIRAHLVQMCLASGDGTYIHHNATEVIDAILSLGVAQASWMPIDAYVAPDPESVPSYWSFHCLVVETNSSRPFEAWASFTYKKKKLVWKRCMNGNSCEPTYLMPLPAGPSVPSADRS